DRVPVLHRDLAAPHAPAHLAHHGARTRNRARPGAHRGRRGAPRRCGRPDRRGHEPAGRRRRPRLARRAGRAFCQGGRRRRRRRASGVPLSWCGRRRRDRGAGLEPDPVSATATPRLSAGLRALEWLGPLAIAAGAMAVAARFPLVSALLLAIAVGVVLANTLGRSAAAAPVLRAAEGTSKHLLRAGIVLLGLRIALSDLVGIGW